MPLAAVVNTCVFCVHGGIPSPALVDKERTIATAIDEDIPADMPALLPMAQKLATALLFNDVM